MRYPRDPTLDPQLVWRGKDEQDAADLEVPKVPIYIGETIDPLALIEELRAESEGRRRRAAARLPWALQVRRRRPPAWMKDGAHPQGARLTMH